MLDFQLFDDAGIVWSQREKLALKQSLPQLQRKNNLKMIYPWGKIQGIHADYIVVQGREEFLSTPISFFSTDCVTWTQLPELDQEALEKCNKMQDLFYGDPNHEYVIRESPAGAEAKAASKEIPVDDEGNPLPEPDEDEPPADPEAAPKPKEIKYAFKEDKRLAVFILQVDHATAIIPKGFLRLDATHHIVLNRMYTGMSQGDALKAESYFHQREPEAAAAQEVLAQEGLSNTTAFLDSIDTDAPIGCWSMQYDSATRLVLLRHLLWPGFVMFLRPESPNWGRCYVGNGVQNVDIAFMLPPTPLPPAGTTLQEQIAGFNKSCTEAVAPPPVPIDEEEGGN